MDLVLRVRLIQVMALVVFDFVVIGGLIARRNQSQRDTFFEFDEVKSAFVTFLIVFRVTMNISIMYLLSKDAPSKGLFLIHGGFWESMAIAFGHGVNINFVMRLLCLRLDISDKDTSSPGAKVSDSDGTCFLTDLTRALSIVIVFVVIVAWILYWCFGGTEGNNDAAGNQQSNENQQQSNENKDNHLKLEIFDIVTRSGPRVDHAKMQ